MNKSDLIFGWVAVLIIVVGLILAALRARAWIDRNRKPDPRQSIEYTGEHRFSLRRER